MKRVNVKRFMNTDRTSLILSRLETGLRTDSAHLKKLDLDFGATLRNARDLGLEQKFSKGWDTTWNQQWNIVEGLLRRIRRLVTEMDGAIERSDSGRLQEAWNAWESIQSEDVHLAESISEIRAQASALNAAARIEWNLLSTAFEANLETIHAYSEALRVKLALLTEHSNEEVDPLGQGIPKKLQTSPEVNKEKHQQELNAAVVKLDKEHHQSGGFLDVVKALFLWVESPEERVKSDRAL